MDNTTPSNQAQPPFNQPPVQSGPTPPSVASPQAPLPPGVSPKRSKALPIALGIGGVLVLLAVLAFVLLFPAIQKQQKAMATVDNFYAYSIAGDTKKLATLYDDETAKGFVESAAQKVDKSCKYKSGSYKDTSKGDTTSADVEGVCTAGVKDWSFGLTYNKDNEWMISKLVFNGTGTSAAQTTEPSGALACIEPSDVNQIPNSAVSTDVYSYFYDDNVFFNADATTYVYPDQTAEKIALFAEFYKNNSGKAFAFNIFGSVNEKTKTSGGVELAGERAAKIKAELVAAGVPQDRIVIDEPISMTNDYITESSRNVTLKIVPDRDCGATATSTSGR